MYYMNPWSTTNYDDNNNNMTTYLSSTMFHMRIDPNAPSSNEQYKEDGNEEEIAPAADHAKEAKEQKSDPPAEEKSEVKQESLSASTTPTAAETVPASSNPGTPAAVNNPSVPPGVPTDHTAAVPVAAAPLAAAATSASGANEAVIEERGEVSMLYVGRVIGKGGEVRLLSLWRP